MKEKVTELRVWIDGLAQLTKGLKPFMQPINTNDFAVDEEIPINYISSKQTDKATDSLFFAKAWLGKVLGELGTNTPYANDGKRKTVKDIEPAADVETGNDWKNSSLKTHIEKVDWLRQEINRIILQVQPLWNIDSLDTWGVAAIENCFTHLSEARFHLGFELERIRENDRD